MQKALSAGDGRRTVVLYGLGGIGKTQLTIAYAKRHRNEYSASFWINIKDEDSIKQSFARASSQILRAYPSANRLSAVDTTGKLDDVVEGVKQWLSLPMNTRWLLVYDNYDNPKLPGQTDGAAVDIRQFLPEAYHGSIIITTRSSQVKIGKRMRIEKMVDIRDSLEILSHTSGREGVLEGMCIVHL